MKIAFLTSSRADFGIYLPLLKAMRQDSFFDLRLIVFGTHLSSFHGHTIHNIFEENFTIDHQVQTTVASDTEEAIATSMALTSMKFASIWQKEKGAYDLVFCLGDRYEMFAGVAAGVPFNIPFAHIHGGETTLGAIDNKFRHALSLFSFLHFTATEAFSDRVKQITLKETNVHTVGALSLDNLETIHLFSPEQFFEKFGIDINKPSILVTYHPETATTENNEMAAQELIEALKELHQYQIIITMPNADTAANAMRRMYSDFAKQNSNVCLVENFGTAGYFTCMQYCKLLVGNSSSGIIEAASMSRYVVNIGDRQNGRSVSENVIHCVAESGAIITACKTALDKGAYTGSNIYYGGGAAKKIIEVLKNERVRSV